MKRNLLFVCMGTLFLLFTGLNSCKKQQELSGPVSTADTGKMVQTPFGLIPESNTHLVENGYQLRIEQGHIFKLNAATGVREKDFGTLSRTVTPLRKNGLQRIFPFAQPAKASVPGNSVANWISDAYWVATAPLTYFKTSWVVPASPTANDGQTLYIFNGFE